MNNPVYTQLVASHLEFSYAEMTSAFNAVKILFASAAAFFAIVYVNSKCVPHSTRQQLDYQMRRVALFSASNMLILDSLRKKAYAQDNGDEVLAKVREKLPQGNNETPSLDVSPVRDTVFTFTTVEETASFIKEHCTTILSAVQSTGRPLYRGETIFGENRSGGQQKPVLMFPKPDLLSPATYDSPTAADFFTSFTEYMEKSGRSSKDSGAAAAAAEVSSTVVSARNGHLATPNVLDASKWGPVCSVWPLDR
jgi:hypothetical protein